MTFRYRAIEYAEGGIVVAYNVPDTDVWTAIADYPLGSRATAIAHAHALNQQHDPDFHTKALVDLAKAKWNDSWERMTARRKPQRDLFDPEPSEDPPEDHYESLFDKHNPTDPDLPF